MRLNVNKLLHTPDARQDIRFEMDLSDLEFGGSYPVSDPVVVDCRLENKAGLLLCGMTLTTTLHCICDRCGEAYDADKTTRYDCVLAEARESDESDDIILLDNDEVDVEELARDAFILDMDTKFLCSEDCRGLCPGCGVNLNRESCRCKKQWTPVWRSWHSCCRRMSELLLYYIAAQAIKTKEVSTWQSLREKYPSKDAIRDVLPYGSWQLPRWWRAPSAARCISPTECARSAAATTAARSRSSSLWPRNKFCCAFARGKHRFPLVFTAPTLFVMGSIKIHRFTLCLWAAILYCACVSRQKTV